jgi:two-component system response regulator PhoP
MKRALLVGDRNLFREVLAVMLELSGEIDLVIVDLDLPNDDGISLIENIREAETDVPVLTLTTGRSLECRALAVRAGASEVLSTSSSSEKIVGTVNRLVGA